MNHVQKNRLIISVATECNWPQKVFLHLKPQTYFSIQIECFFKDSFPVVRFKNILKRRFIRNRFRESCAYVDSLVTSVFFLLCSNNVIFLLSGHIQRLLLSIQPLPYIYFILSFFSNFKSNYHSKNRLFSPHNRHSYPSSMNEVCHH